MKKKISIIAFILLVITFGFRVNHTPEFPNPKGWPLPQYDFRKNPLDSKKIELGRMLFYDPILSRDSSISCTSCHSQYSAFTHVDHALSHGIDGKIGTRNSPALMNLAWGKSFMWDGAINHLDMQALAPISNTLEMDDNIKNVVFKLQRSAIYSKLFYTAFGVKKIQGAHVLKSLSQFMLTLVSSNSKYDKMKQGAIKFTEAEHRGYLLFQNHCSSCHKEPLFSNYQFENNGLHLDDSLLDIGRMRVTQHAVDSLKFKVPTLRNIEFTSPYMHDGRFQTLNQVLNHYIKGIMPSSTLSGILKNGINLSPNEKADVVAFLLTLSDKEFVFNPQVSYPKSSFQKNLKQAD